MARVLLLIDSSIADYEKIVNAALENVTPVVFDGLADTYEIILGKVAAAAAEDTKYATVGLAQHGSAVDPDYSITRAESPALLEDPESWYGVIAFFNTLKALYNVNTVDLISCLIYSNPLWTSALNRLEAATGLHFRASSDDTGNLANGGNWIMESDNTNIEHVYFSEAIREYTGLLYPTTYEYKSSTEKNVSAANPLSTPMVSASNPVNGMVSVPYGCSVVTWGDISFGGVSTAVSSQLSSGIKAVTSNATAFAAINENGRVITWGDPANGGNSASVANDLSSGVTHVAAANAAFAALKADGSVVAWGYSNAGNMTVGNIYSVKNDLSSGVVAIASTASAFAALKSNGSVITWGHPTYGGDSSLVMNDISSGVVALASTPYTFAALKTNGSVVVWGWRDSAGTTNPIGVWVTGGVKLIAANELTLAAIKTDGSVVLWGGPNSGGVNDGGNGDLSSGVVAIASGKYTFAALKENGSLVTWGNPNNGGINTTGADLTGYIVALEASNWMSSAIKSDGSVITWISHNNTAINNAGVANDISKGVVMVRISGYTSTAALKENGAVVTWGTGPGANSSAVKNDLSSGVIALASTSFAYAAIKSNGSVVAWGDISGGGSTTSVANDLSIGVTAIVSNDRAFAAFVSPVVAPIINITDISSTPLVGTSFTLSIMNPYNGATYQWYRGATPITGETGIAYTVTNSTTTDSGNYKVVQTVNDNTLDSNVTPITIIPIVQNVDSSAITSSPILLLESTQPNSPPIIAATLTDFNSPAALLNASAVATNNNTNKIVFLQNALIGSQGVQRQVILEEYSVNPSPFPFTVTNKTGTIGSISIKILNYSLAVADPSTKIYMAVEPVTFTINSTPGADTSSAVAVDFRIINGAGQFVSSGMLMEAEIAIPGASGTVDMWHRNDTTSLYEAEGQAVETPAGSGKFRYTFTKNDGWLATNTDPNGDKAICFLGNAQVLTPHGYRSIDSLSVGDKVKTADGRSVKIQKVFVREYVPSSRVNPYVIPAGRFGATEDVLVSPEHRIQVEGRGFLKARKLGLEQQKMTDVFKYYNLGLPNWNTDTLVVSGVVAESLADVRRVVITMEEFAKLIAEKYGKLTPAVLTQLKRTCAFMPNGKVNIPIYNNKKA